MSRTYMFQVVSHFFNEEETIIPRSKNSTKKRQNNDSDMVKLIRKDFSSFLKKLLPGTQVSFSFRIISSSIPSNRISRRKMSQTKDSDYVQKTILSISFPSLKQKSKILRKSKIPQGTHPIDPNVHDSQQKQKTKKSLQIKERKKESFSQLQNLGPMQLPSQSTATITTSQEQVKESKYYNNTIDENNAEWLRSMFVSKNSLCDVVCNTKYVNAIASDNSNLFLVVKHDTKPSETSDRKQKK